MLTGGSAGGYVSTGHLVYATRSGLKAVAFDADHHQTRGRPVALPDVEVATTPDNGAAEFALSETGTLIFITPDVPSRWLPRTMSWVDRRGIEERAALSPAAYGDPHISPDGSRVAVDIVGVGRNIWIWDLQRQSMTKLTDGPTEDLLPVWTLDGRRVFFSSDRGGNFDVYSQAADGAAPARLEFSGPGAQMTVGFTPDGRLLLVEDFKDIDIFNPARPDRLEPLLHSKFTELLATVSPDGHWIAYESNESADRFEIFLRSFPDLSGRREKVSINGGRYPRWGPKGGELFYVDLDGHMMAASVSLSPSLRLGTVTKLFDWEKPPRGPSGMPYDVSPIDGRFLRLDAPVKDASSGTSQISVVLNWLQELKRLAPAN